MRAKRKLFSSLREEIKHFKDSSRKVDEDARSLDFYITNDTLARSITKKQLIRSLDFHLQKHGYILVIWAPMETMLDLKQAQGLSEVVTLIRSFLLQPKRCWGSMSQFISTGRSESERMEAEVVLKKVKVFIIAFTSSYLCLKCNQPYSRRFENLQYHLTINSLDFSHQRVQLSETKTYITLSQLLD